LVGPEPEAAEIELQGMGWMSKHGTGKGADSITGGPEVTWTKTPTQWSHDFFKHLFEYEWELTKSPAGAQQWVAKNAEKNIPDAHNPSVKHLPTMLTTDLSLKFDPEYLKISKRFFENPEAFADAFARAWHKLTHRDMGPKSCYIGPEVAAENLIWQDPIPSVNHKLVDEKQTADLKKKVLDSGLTISELVSTAWASASTYRDSDKRGGANGARIRLAPQRNWEVNNPAQLSKVLNTLENLQQEFNTIQTDGTLISLADMIVLAGSAAVEKAANNAGHEITVPFKPGRMDASQNETDIDSFAPLEPYADGFRNYTKDQSAGLVEHLLVDRAQLLSLSVPEMTVLVGGLRILKTNHNNSDLGVLTRNPETLTNDFFVNLLDMNTTWKAVDDSRYIFEGKNRSNGSATWKATSVDLIFGSHSELRAIAEVYACSDSKEKFVKDFVAAWNKVMNLDRF
jgi:catalase-peroxidase